MIVDRGVLETIEDVRNFVFAGVAVVTFQSEKTGDHMTFKVTAPEKPWDGEVHFVAMLKGSDNEDEASYTYIATIFNRRDFRLTKRSRMNAESKPVLAWRYFFRYFNANQLPPAMLIFHEGICGRCGHRLTVPESVITGLGPVCREKMGL